MLKPSMIPTAIPVLRGNEKKYLNSCIDEGFVSSVGPFVSKFEKMLADETHAQYALAVSSGTCALHLSLITLGIKPGDLVIIPSFTFIATANAVSHCGANPWVIDISLDDWNIDAELLENTLKSETCFKAGSLFHNRTHQKIAAIMPVYCLGLPCDMDRLKVISREFNIPLVIDAAAGIGSKYKSQELGFHGGDLTTISFNGNKNITSGGGGAILSNDELIINKARHLSATARLGLDYDHDQVGYNYRMTNIEAAVGCAQLEQLKTFLKRKKEVREFYNESFYNIPNVSLLPENEYSESSYWLSGIFLKNNNIRAIIRKLIANNIEARLFWKPIHLQDPYVNCLKTEVRVSEYIWDKILILPCSSSIKDEELLFVRDVVLQSLKEDQC